MDAKVPLSKSSNAEIKAISFVPFSEHGTEISSPV
jgi:hypothetical protein